MNDRMKGMKLGSFSGIKKSQPESTKKPEPTPEVKTDALVKSTKTKPVKTAKSKAKVGKKVQKKEQLVTVNIKIRKDQKEWLTDTSSAIRDNNTEPVPPSERVYPQHLIGVAIDLLQNVDVNWSEVKNVDELREQLDI